MAIASQLQLRRGTTPQHAVFTGAPGEVTVDTDKKTVVVHDGSTAGGFPSATAAELAAGLAVKADTTALAAGLATKVSVGAAAGGALSGTYPNPTLAAITATGSTAARSVQDRFADVFHVKDFGAVGNGTTDDRAAIQAAINAASTAGNGVVYFDAKTYAISSTLTVPSAVTLIGKGAGQYPTAANVSSPLFAELPKTCLLALAGFASNTCMLSVKTPNQANYASQAVRIQGIMLDCRSNAARGMDIVSIKHSYFEDILVFLPESIGILEDCLPLADTVTQTNGAGQFCLFNMITVWCSPSGTAVGWRQTGNNSHNINQNTYTNIKIVHGNGTGMDIVNADTNTYVNLSTYAFGQGYGAVLHGSDGATPDAFCRKLSFTNLLLGGANTNYGTAQAGTTTSITLKSTSPSTDVYTGKTIYITGGFSDAVGQKSTITAYNGSTKVATVSPAFVVAPTNTSQYQIEGAGGILVKAGTNGGIASYGHYATGYQSVGNGGKMPILEDGTSFTYADERGTTLSDTVWGDLSLAGNASFVSGFAGKLRFEGKNGDSNKMEYCSVTALRQGVASVSESGRIDLQTFQNKHIGTAQAGSSNTITLASTASSVPNAYVGKTIYLTGGTGAGQSKTITGYAQNTKIATVDSNWSVNPDSTTTYALTGQCESRAYVGHGLVLGDAANGDRGIGTINVKNGYYINNVPWLSGNGTPEGNVTAPVGGLWLRTDGGAGTTLYVKETGSGNTGWVAK